MKKLLTAVLAALMALCLILPAVAEGEVTIGQALYAAHGTKCFAVLTVAMQDGVIADAYIDEFQFMTAGEAVGVPNSDADFGQSYPEGKVLASKRENAEMYSANMAAAGHEVKIIQRFVGRRQCIPEDCIVRIAVKHHDVRHLQCRRRADAHARGQTRGDRALRGADGRDRIRRVIIRLQIECADNTAAHGAARQRALHEHETVRHGAEHAVVEVTMHGLLDLARCRTLIALAEIKLRQHQPQSRRRVADGVLHRLPIAGVRRELVTGDDAPAPHIRMRRQ